MKPYRILVTGSRDWQDQQAVCNALADVVRALPADREITVIHGACPNGADRIADAWARWHQNRGQAFDIEEHPARAFGPWPACGPRRNAHMVKLGADACFAFIGPCTSPRCRRIDPHGSHGASGCADLAEAAGIPTRRCTP